MLARDLLQSSGLVQKNITSVMDRRIAAGESLRAISAGLSLQPRNFRRTDVKRTVQAMQAAGLKVRRVEIHGGTERLRDRRDGAE